MAIFCEHDELHFEETLWRRFPLQGLRVIQYVKYIY